LKKRFPDIIDIIFQLGDFGISKVDAFAVSYKLLSCSGAQLQMPSGIDGDRYTQLFVAGDLCR
jgi:hypothetical protein